MSGCCPTVATNFQQILQQKSSHPRSRVNCRQDKQRLKHDGEVIPQRQRRRTSRNACKHVRHADGKGRRTPRAIKHCLFAEIPRQIGHLRLGYREAGRRNFRHYFRRRSFGIDGKIFARLNHARRDHRH